MIVIISKSLRYEIETEDAKYCDNCRYAGLTRCNAFGHVLIKKRNDKSYRRCNACLFAFNDEAGI